jgi:1,2-diacylglycerol 3-alpha-glucosyltransferase
MESTAPAPEIAIRAKPLRIGMFSESFHPVQNGVTTSVRTLVAELRRQGHHVWVFAPEHQNQPEHETNVVRFPSFVTHLNPEYPLAYPFLPRLRLGSHVERLKLDVIHTHTPFVLGLAGADLAIRRGIPLISTFHTLYSEYSHYISFLPEALTQGLLEAFLPWYYNRCATVICPSKTAADHLKSGGVDRPVEIIPTGIPIPPKDTVDAASRMGVRARLGVTADVPLLLYAGRLAPEKQIAWLLDTFVHIRESVPTAILAIAGGGPLLETLIQHAGSIGIEESTRFLGPVPRYEMDAVYAAADLFVFPSPSETQGLVIGEARAAGTPAVVIDSGGAPETVRHGVDGFRIAPSDQDGFAACVVRILRDRDLLARLSKTAGETAGDQTPERMAARILAIYHRAREQASTIFVGADMPLRSESKQISGIERHDVANT